MISSNKPFLKVFNDLSRIIMYLIYQNAFETKKIFAILYARMEGNAMTTLMETHFAIAHEDIPEVAAVNCCISI